MKALGKYIVDVRILNGAPLSFKYNVIKDGMMLLSKDDKGANFEVWEIFEVSYYESDATEQG